MKLLVLPGDGITEATLADLCEVFERKHLDTIASVPLPPCDPVLGAGGPLFEHRRG